MLKTIRRLLAVVFFAAITFLLLDVTGTAHRWLSWMAKMQFLPAVLAGNVVIIVILLVLTLLFGRIYCSVICPLGVMQDGIAWLGKRRKKNRYTYSPAKTIMRYVFFIVMVVAILAGLAAVVRLLAPYSAYGRIVTMLFQPLYALLNNLLAYIAESVESYAFYSVDVWFKSLYAFIVAVVTLVVIAVLSYRNGRTYCNTVCPVGTLLGLLSRFSVFRIRFDEDRCRKCGLCTRNCKSACIDYKTLTVDHSRCVVCGDCLDVCKHDAISYVAGNPFAALSVRSSADVSAGGDTVDSGKRSFLLSTGLLSVAALAQEKESMHGGLAVIEDKVIPNRQTPITPPGSQSARNMAHKCTGCQLCVSECPNSVLRPNDDLLTFMQPVMSYERGYCRPECNRCSQVCPTGAIISVEHDEKASIQIGHAVWVKKNCLAADGVSCDNCARHCPTGAIEMVFLNEDDDESPMVPSVNEAACIGCGACEHLCPARPFSAMVVEGHEVHKII